MFIYKYVYKYLSISFLGQCVIVLPGLSKACVCSSLFASWFILWRSLNPLNLFSI